MPPDLLPHSMVSVNVLHLVVLHCVADSLLGVRCFYL